MSPSILHIKPEELDTLEKRGNYTVCIIGCDQIGILHAYLFTEAGFKVKCADADLTIIGNLAKAKLPFLAREVELKLKKHLKTGWLSATSDIRTAVSQSDIICITASTTVDEKKKVDYSPLEKTCKQIGLGLHSGSLVIVMRANGFGVTEGLIKEVLENTSGLKVGVDFGLAYSPTPLINELTIETLANHERTVAASNKDSLIAASIILEKITKKGLEKIENIKVAEAVSLFEGIQQNMNLALANEFALFCEKARLDYMEARCFLNSVSHFAFPLPTQFDENTQKHLYLLLEYAENLNLKLRLPAVADEVNEEAAKHAVNLVKDALMNCGKTLRRAKISILGLAQLPNTKSPPKKWIKEIAKILENRGAKINIYDPYLSGEEISEIQQTVKKSLSEAAEGADCILIAAEHDYFKRLNPKKLKVMMKMPAAIVDLQGIVEPSKIEKEGFIYRGLGRGVWTK